MPNPASDPNRDGELAPEPAFGGDRSAGASPAEAAPGGAEASSAEEPRPTDEPAGGAAPPGDGPELPPGAESSGSFPVGFGSTPEARRDALRLLLPGLLPSDIAEALSEFQTADVAAILDECELPEQLAVLRALPDDRAVEVFEYLDSKVQVELLREFKPRRAGRILEGLSDDDRADLLGVLDAEEADRFLDLLSKDEQERTRALLAYDESSAGGIMSADFAWLSPDDTVAQAIEKIRTGFKDVEMLYYLYVLDDDRRLLGLVTLRHLIAQPADALIESLMVPNVISVSPTDDQEFVARELGEYDFLAIPVVAPDGEMLGIITFDDLHDVMEEEAAEDQEKFGGVSPSEDPYVDQTTWQGIKQRFPWLALFLVLSSGSGYVISAFSEAGYTGGFFIYVFALLPMVAAMAGNAATQTATLVIRAITVQDIRTQNAWEVLGRELKLGVSMGAMLGVMAFARAWLSGGGYGWELGLAVALSVLLVMAVSTVTGALLPMFFKKLGLDPAVMSSPFIATVIDIVTITLYFAISIAVYKSFILESAQG